MKNLAHNSLGLLFWLFFLLGPGLPLQAQDDDNEQKIHLKVIKEKDGVEEVYEKTYDSKEALLNDEKLKELNVDVKKFEGGLMLQKQNGSISFLWMKAIKTGFNFIMGSINSVKMQRK